MSIVYFKLGNQLWIGPCVCRYRTIVYKEAQYWWQSCGVCPSKPQLEYASNNPTLQWYVKWFRINYCAFTYTAIIQCHILEPVEPVSIDLDTLLIQLRPQVGPKWYQFGEAAGIERKVLDKYASDCAPEECIVEVLDYWLRNCTTRPTWKGIAWILKAINLQQLAFDIERVYSTGITVTVHIKHLHNLHCCCSTTMNSARYALEYAEYLVISISNP